MNRRIYCELGREPPAHPPESGDPHPSDQRVGNRHRLAIADPRRQQDRRDVLGERADQRIGLLHQSEPQILEPADEHDIADDPGKVYVVGLYAQRLLVELAHHFSGFDEPSMAQPVIGLTLDHEPPGGYSNFPWYAIRENYCNAVRRAGGLPILLPHDPDAAFSYLDRIDGLIVTGGGFDVDPALFGAETRHPTVKTKDRRTAFEFAATQGALARGMPVLGICGGQQLLNVVLGGTLIQHIPDEVPGCVAHRQENPRNEPGHSVRVIAGTLLHRITGAECLGVNSAHHQAVKEAGPGLVIDAVAEDGVVEGIEDPRHHFCLGVQWHPEFEINEADRLIFRAFVEVAAG
jgi:putative glutamine amidotransferase